MSLVVTINGDAQQLLATTNAAEAALGKVEVAGARAGDAATKGFGNSSTAAEKAKQSTQSLTEQMEKLSGLKLEGNFGSALASRFGELGTAFDSLASKGALEAAAMVGLGVEAIHLGDEYVNLRNNALRLSESYDQVDSTLSNQLALSKDLHASLEQTMELSTIVKERTEDMGISQSTAARYSKELGEAVQLSGHSIGDASSVISRLSFALESGIPAGREMKNIMREFPDIADALKAHLHATSGEIVEMGNKGRISLHTLFESLDEAGTAMQTKLGQRTETTSMQWQHFKDTLVLTAGKLVENSGALAALGGVLKVVGDIVQLLVGGLALLHDALGNVGTIAVVAGAAIATGFGGIAVAAGAFELAKHAGEALADWLDKDLIAQTKLNAAEADAYEAFNKQMKAVNDQYDAIIRDYDAHNELVGAINAVATALAGGQKIWDDMNAKTAAAAKKAEDYAAALHMVQAEQAQLKAAGMKHPTQALTADQVAIVRGSVDAQQELNDSMSRYGGVLSDIHKREAERSRGIEDLNGALKAHLITHREYAEELKKYQGQLSLEAQILQEIDGPQQKFEQQLAALNDLLAIGKISMRQYGEALKKFIDALPKPEGNPASVIDEMNFSLQRAADLMLRVGSLRTKLDLTKDADGNTIDNSTRNNASMTMFSLGQAADVGSVPSVSDVAGTARANGSGFESEADKYDKALSELNAKKPYVSADNFAASVKALNEQFGATVSPAEKFRKEIDDAGVLFVRGAISAGDYQKKVQDVGKEQEKLADSGHDFASGVSRGWHAIRDEAQDTATTISTAMKSAFDDINANIVSMVTTGSADWGKLASTIEADFAKLALQKVEGSLFDAATGGAATGAAVGTTATTTMLASAGIVGTAIGVAAAGAMEAGSAISSAASSASMVAAAGLWTGGDVAIPRAANGYEGKVGGVAGVDTKLFATMVSPGETVSVRTEGQMAAQQRNAGGQGVTIVNKHDTRGELADGLSSGDYDTHVINILKRNAGAVQSILKK